MQIQIYDFLSFWNIFTFLVLFHCFKFLFYKLRYLTTSPPAIPLGIKRQAKYQNKSPVTIDLTNYYEIHYAFISVFIVPYESMVITIDEFIRKQDEKDQKETKDYCLNYQERQHSAMHYRLNKQMYEHNPNSFVLLLEIFRIMATFITKNLIPLHNIVNGMVAIFENQFYYLRAIDGLFNVFSNKNAFDKIYLWHFYEEIEHHQETTYLFGVYEGYYRFIYLPFSLVIYISQITFVQLFTLLGIIVSSPLLYKVPLILAWFNDYCKYLGSTIVCMILLTFNLNAKEEMVRNDLKEYRRMYEERFGVKLEEKDIYF
jgi:hypothetical protein